MFAIVPLYRREPVAAVESVAVTVKLYGPAVFDVPLITPAVLKVTPFGSEPPVTANVYGAVPSDAVSVWLYGESSVGVGRVAGATVITAIGNVDDAAVLFVSDPSSTAFPLSVFTNSRYVPGITVDGTVIA